MPTASAPAPTIRVRMHCPDLTCPFVSSARSATEAHAALEDHIVRCHGTLVRPA